MWLLVASVIGISLSGVMMPGPMFAVVLAKSYKSPWAGTQMSLGHAVIEVPLILLIRFGFGSFFEYAAVQLILSLVGGAMIVWMGISMFRARATVVREGKDSPYNAFVAGIVMTVLNPFFLLWWATVGIALVMKFTDYGMIGLLVMNITHWACDFVWLSFLSVSVYKTHSFLSKRWQEWIFIIISLLLVFFGIRFIVIGIQSMLA
jgi:threonine/homoserine/homoserine lactone efflux protein